MAALIALAPAAAIAAECDETRRQRTPGSDESSASASLNSGLVLIKKTYQTEDSITHVNCNTTVTYYDLAPIPLGNAPSLYSQFLSAGSVTIPSLGGGGNYAFGISSSKTTQQDVVAVGQSDTTTIIPIPSTAFTTAVYHAFRYSAATGTVDLGSLGGATGFSSAYGVNGDGSVIVGASALTGGLTAGGLIPTQHAFRWTSATGMVDLGSIAPGASRAFGVSEDGTIVVGDSSIGGGVTHAFKWTQANGFTDLGSLSAGTNSRAAAISGDGSAIVGEAQLTVGGGPETRAFRWTQAGGMVNLGVLGGHTASSASGVSADGAVVVGVSDPIFVAFSGLGLDYTDNARAFRWTQATGIRDLNTLLSDAGVNMTGTTLISALGVSPGGQFISGVGLFADKPGERQPYVVRYIDGATTDETASGPPIGGITTAGSVQDSVNQLGLARQAVAVQQHGFADPLIGGSYRVGNGGSDAAAFASVGSAAGGLSGRKSFFGGHLTLMGGVALAEENYRNASIKNATLWALAVRYTQNLSGKFIAFGDIGGWLSPSGTYTFNRSYANGAGTASGSAQTSGTDQYVFGRLGIAANVGPIDQIAVIGELGRQWLRTGAYDETLSALNPFEAHALGSKDRMNVTKMRGQWTHSFANFETTLWAAAAYGFGYRTDFVVAVPGFGGFAPQTGDRMWAEYGANLNYKLNPQIAFDAFFNGITGAAGIGHRVHVGGAVRASF